MKTTSERISFAPSPAALARACDAIRGFLVGGGVETASADVMVARIGDACRAAMARTVSGNDIEIDVLVEGSGVAALVKDATADVDLRDLGLMHRPLGSSGDGLYLITCMAGAIEVSSGA